jgi:hypothetical protein
MELKALKPVAGEGRGVVLGFVLTFFLHLVAFMAIAIVGTVHSGPDGALLVLPFLALIGIAQWFYLAPAAWLFWRRGWTGTAKGVVIAGGLMLLLNGLYYGGLGVRTLQYNAEVQRIQQDERDHPHDYISTQGVVTLVDDSHFEFTRDDDGTVVSLQTWDKLDYIVLKKGGGGEKRTRDVLKPGARVSVEYSQERGKPPVSASIVRVYEQRP